MKKILIILILGNFLFGCDMFNSSKKSDVKISKEEEKEKEKEKEKEEEKEKVKEEEKEEVKYREIKTDNIFNLDNIEILEKIKNRLKILYEYSTEKKYIFQYPNEPIYIVGENEYIFKSYTNSEIYSIVKIELDNLNTKILLGNTETILLDYNIFQKLMEKIIEVEISTQELKVESDMEVALYENIELFDEKGKNVFVKIIFKKSKLQNEVILKDNKTDKEILKITENNIENLKMSNSKEFINKVVMKYSPELLSYIINLGEKYKKLDFLVENSNKITEHIKNKENTNISYTDMLNFDKIKEFSTNITYYASGRVKTIRDINFPDENETNKIFTNLATLENETGNMNLLNKEKYDKIAKKIALSIKAKDLALNKSDEENKELIEVKKKAKDIFDKLDIKLEELRVDEIKDKEPIESKRISIDIQEVENLKIQNLSEDKERIDSNKIEEEKKNENKVESEENIIERIGGKVEKVIENKEKLVEESN